jgi:hypothetical protein
MFYPGRPHYPPEIQDVGYTNARVLEQHLDPGAKKENQGNASGTIKPAPNSSASVSRMCHESLANLSA